jgi:hypothetical protein
MALSGQVRPPHRLHPPLLRPGHLQGPARPGGVRRPRRPRRLRSERAPPSLHENPGVPVLRPLGRASPRLGAECRSHLRISPRPGSHGEGAQNLSRDQGISERLGGLLCPQDTYPSFPLVPGPQRPPFVSRSRPQRVRSYSFLDPQCGLSHGRWQTWLPCTVQVYVTGHDGLAQQLVPKPLGFVPQPNAVPPRDHPAQAQAWPTASPRSKGRASSTVGPGRSIRGSGTWSPAPPCLGSALEPRTPPTCCSSLAWRERAGTAPSGVRRGRRLPPRTSWAFAAARGSAAAMAKSTPTPKTTAGSAPGSSPAGRPTG